MSMNQHNPSTSPSTLYDALANRDRIFALDLTSLQQVPAWDFPADRRR
jgi:hypothetical protein